MKSPLISLAAALTAALATHAASISYVITDIGTFEPYSVDNTGQSFSGTGFVGLYETARNGADQFVHLFGVEQNDYSRTALQVDISALAGATITSAYLSFDLIDGGAGPQDVTLTSFTADGTLEWLWTPPDVLGTLVRSVVDSPNSLDVTSLLQERVSNGANWFGLHLQGSTEYMWTYTSAGEDGNPDSANVRLNVEFANVPEATPGSVLGLAGITIGGLAVLRRRRN